MVHDNLLIKVRRTCRDATHFVRANYIDTVSLSSCYLDGYSKINYNDDIEW